MNGKLVSDFRIPLWVCLYVCVCENVNALNYVEEHILTVTLYSTVDVKPRDNKLSQFTLSYV